MPHQSSITTPTTYWNLAMDGGAWENRYPHGSCLVITIPGITSVQPPESIVFDIPLFVEESEEETSDADGPPLPYIDETSFNIQADWTEFYGDMKEA